MVGHPTGPRGHPGRPMWPHTAAWWALNHTQGVVWVPKCAGDNASVCIGKLMMMLMMYVI